MEEKAIFDIIKKEKKYLIQLIEMDLREAEEMPELPAVGEAKKKRENLLKAIKKLNPF